MGRRGKPSHRVSLRRRAPDRPSVPTGPGWADTGQPGVGGRAPEEDSWYRDPADGAGGPEVMDTRQAPATGVTHRHRRSTAAGFGLADLRFSLGLLVLAYAVTLVIWYVHRTVTD